MTEVGIRALKQNASAVVAEATAGTVITITDRGRPVAQLGPLRAGRVDQLIGSGRLRPARRPFAELPAPSDGPTLSADLSAARESERY